MWWGRLFNVTSHLLWKIINMNSGIIDLVNDYYWLGDDKHWPIRARSINSYQDGKGLLIILLHVHWFCLCADMVEMEVGSNDIRCHRKGHRTQPISSCKYVSVQDQSTCVNLDCEGRGRRRCDWTSLRPVKRWIVVPTNPSRPDDRYTHRLLGGRRTIWLNHSKPWTCESINWHPADQFIFRTYERLKTLNTCPCL